jgi:HEAT repeat protein
MRWRAGETLARIGEPAVGPLTETLSDPNPHVRCGAAEALGKAGTVHDVTPLITRLGDPAVEVRLKAIDALGSIGDVRAVAPLIEALNDGHIDVRLKSADALARIGEPATDPLIGTLESPHPYVRANAAIALGRIGDVNALEPLAALTNDSDELVRKSASDAVDKLERKEAPIKGSLLHRLKKALR